MKYKRVYTYNLNEVIACNALDLFRFVHLIINIYYH